MAQYIKLFVILGTQKFPFHRLLKAVEEIIKEGLFTKDEVLVQSGIFEPDRESINFVNSIPVDQFNSILQNAEIVITHAGVNSILSCMRLQKHFIIAPRLKQYGEHVDDHQLEIAEVMRTQFNVLVLNDVAQLCELIQKVENHTYEKWNFDNRLLLKSISDFLSE